MSSGGERATGRLRGGELRPGTRLGSLELQAELGRGGMGIVLAARDLETGRDVAVKTLLASPGGQQLERFRREGQILASLHHPGIVGIHGGGEVLGRPYLVFELVPGARPIDAAARELAPVARVRLVRDAARALGHAHARGVVHRDVKASNLLVDRAGAVRVADFGLALAADLERLTATGAVVGTPETMAPEQCDGRRGAIGPRTDVWGLGVVLYELLTGVAPFAGDSLISIMARVCEARPPRPRSIDPSIPRPIEAVVLLAMSAAPADRPADGEALAVLLDDALAGRGPPGPRSAGLLVAAAALAVVVALVAGILAASRGPADPVSPAVAAGDAPAIAPLATSIPVAAPTPGPAPTPAPVASATTAPAPSAAPGRPPEDILMFGARQLAEQGLPAGMTEYARHLRKAKREPEALEWFRKAGMTGDSGGMEEAGTMLEEGRGAPRDLVAASLWFELASARNETDSTRRLAFFARMGYLGPIDLDRAIALHRRAVMLASKKHDDERFELVTALIERHGPGDLDEAKAMIAGTFTHGRKRYFEGLLADGAPITPADGAAFDLHLTEMVTGDHHERALRQWRARAKGRPESLPSALPPRRLAKLVDEMRHAIAVGPPERAAEPARAAADGGSGEGMLAYGDALASGQGVPKDVVAAAAWYDRAVTFGQPAAALRLAAIVLSPADEPFARQIDGLLAALDRADALPDATVALRTARADALLFRRAGTDAAAAAKILREVAAQDPRAAVLLAEAIAGDRIAPLDEGEARRLVDAVLADPAAAQWHDRARAAIGKP